MLPAAMGPSAATFPIVAVGACTFLVLAACGEMSQTPISPIPGTLQDASADITTSDVMTDVAGRTQDDASVLEGGTDAPPPSPGSVSSFVSMGPFAEHAARIKARGGCFMNFVPIAMSADGSAAVGFEGVSCFASHPALPADIGGAQALLWIRSSGWTPLGFAAPGDTASVAVAISADGSTVVGESLRDPGVNVRAFRWTQASAMVSLGVARAGDDQSNAAAVSADGSVVVGTSQDSSGIAGEREIAYRWTQGAGMTPLGVLPGDTGSEAAAVSADGSAVVGRSKTQTTDTGGPVRAFLWTVASGLADLGGLPGSSRTFPVALSADGSVVTGQSIASDGQSEAFVWTAASGMIGLGSLPGHRNSRAIGVSSDGATVIGVSFLEEMTIQAFRWTRVSGMTALGFLPGDSESTATATNLDASSVVGLSQRVAGGDTSQLVGVGVIWQGMKGLLSLPDLLMRGHVDLTRYGIGQLGDPLAVSANGRVIMGHTSNLDNLSQGWLVEFSPF